ncbi:MAG: amidohydrolase family protein [Planctomycetes bacterium]|nr:amidohydrolase family protein [Planctomycetota bacterium]
MILTAKWILPITQPPIEDGAIAVRDGRIEGLGPCREFVNADVEDLGDCVIMPGLVNAHTHLELSHLRRMIDPPGDLVEWLLWIVAKQHDLGHDPLRERTETSVRAGVEESLAAGVTTIGDISRLCALTRPLLRNGPLRVVSFGEVLGIGTGRHRVDERLRAAGDRQYDSDFLITALSPHAPYSIEDDGIERVIRHAREHDMRTCIHLAESVEEIQFLETGQGRFRELLEQIGVWDDLIPVPGHTPVRWMYELGALGPECVIAHGNYVDADEIDLLCATGTSVAYCPRTHSYFGHQHHPVLELMGGGVNVCVGTDSLASNPSLSVLEELVHIRGAHAELPPDVILAMGTINGARALGLAHEIGSLEPGKQADFAVFRCADDLASHPEQTLLSSETTLDRLYIAGERIG